MNPSRFRSVVPLAMPVCPPQRRGLDARDACILFANDLPLIDGQGADDHSLVGGWSALDPVVLR